RSIGIVYLSVCLAACVRPAAAARPGDDDRFLLLDRELRPSLVRVQNIGPASLHVTEEAPGGVQGGGERDIPLSDVAALAPAWWRRGPEGGELAWVPQDAAATKRANPQALGMLLLADGRRVAGHLGFDAPADRIAWDHPLLSRSTFRLDDVRI